MNNITATTPNEVILELSYQQLRYLKEVLFTGGDFIEQQIIDGEFGPADEEWYANAYAWSRKLARNCGKVSSKRTAEMFEEARRKAELKNQAVPKANSYYW